MRRRIIAVIALIPALLFGCAGPTTNTTAQTGNHFFSRSGARRFYTEFGYAYGLATQ